MTVGAGNGVNLRTYADQNQLSVRVAPKKDLQRQAEAMCDQIEALEKHMAACEQEKQRRLASIAERERTIAGLDSDITRLRQAEVTHKENAVRLRQEQAAHTDGSCSPKTSASCPYR